LSLSDVPYIAMSDGELIECFVSGENRLAFETLVLRHVQGARRYALVICGNAADADDVVQDVLIILYRKLHTYRGKASFSSWLYQIVRHKACDLIRKRRRTACQDVDQLAEVLASSEPQIPDRLHEQEFSQQVFDSIARLSAAEQQLFYLRESEGLSFPEIARVMGEPEGTVKARHWRLKSRLAVQFSDYLEGVNHEK